MTVNKLLNAATWLFALLWSASGIATAQTALTFSQAHSDEMQLDRAGRIIYDSFVTIDDDIRGIWQYPIDNVEQTQMFLLGIGALILADKQLTAYYQDNIETQFEGFSLGEAPLGDSAIGFLPNEDRWLLLGITGSYLAGVALNDEKSQTAAILAGKAITYSYLTTHVILKTMFGRKRPVPNLSTATSGSGDFTTNPYEFGYFHPPYFSSEAYGTSMPSFHFTQYFAAARVYSEVYDDSLIPYGVAGLLAVSNIRGHRHWVSDMVAGAGLGMMIGGVVMRNYSDQSNNSMLVMPMISADGVGVSFTKRF